MKFTPEVIAAIKTLKQAAENDSERNAVSKLEIELETYSNEEWRDVVGYEGLYQVSSKGRVKSFYGKNARILVGQICELGYNHVLLHKGKVRKRVLVHRIVAMAFIPNPNYKSEVNHIDGNKNNNCVENLEWATRNENAKHAFDNGLQIPLRGSDCPWAKLSDEQVAEIRATCIPGNKNFGFNSLARKFNVSEHTIRKIVHFETFKDL